MQIEVSIGEVIDKLTILGIKIEKLDDKEKLANVKKEWDYLNAQIPSNIKEDERFAEFVVKLLEVNKLLWDIEDGKRNHERTKNFDEDFVELARQVYIKNDIRAQIKREINIHFNSNFVEEKSYKAY